MRKILNIFLGILFISTLARADLTNEHIMSNDKPILMIGSSYINSKTRIDDDGIGSLGGLAVGFGSYYSLGDALIRNHNLNGLIVNG
jgi:hypothetical protein